MKKWSIKESIVDMYKRGWTPIQIIKEYGYAKSTVYAAIAEYKKTFEPPSLTPANYAQARKIGISKKAELAKVLFVHPKKLQRFEKELRTIGDFDRYINMFSNGYELDPVITQLSEIFDVLNTFDPGSEVATTIQGTLLVLKKIRLFDQSHKTSK